MTNIWQRHRKPLPEKSTLCCHLTSLDILAQERRLVEDISSIIRKFEASSTMVVKGIELLRDNGNLTVMTITQMKGKEDG